MSSMTEIFGEPISVYTRAQAIEDGELMDVTEWAGAEKGIINGFTIPVALTSHLWAAIESIPDTPACRHQDVRGRAHDVLWMALLAHRGLCRAGKMTGHFVLSLAVKGTRKRKIALRVDLSPGDDGEPVVTIGFPEDF